MTLHKGTLKQLWWIFFLELLAIPLMFGADLFIKNVTYAPAFIILGLVMIDFVVLKIIRKWSDGYASFVYWFLYVHLFIFLIPLLFGRPAVLMTIWDKSFEQIRFISFSGPEFYSLSEKMYFVLLCGILLDIIIHTLKFKRLKSKKQI